VPILKKLWIGGIRSPVLIAEVLNRKGVGTGRRRRQKWTAVQVARLISEYSLERPRTPYRERLDRAKQTRARLDKMLRAYWAFLGSESEPLAEGILERGLKEAALKGTHFI
jgi:hypothetical protein